MTVMMMERRPYVYVLTLCVITPLWFVFIIFDWIMFTGNRFSSAESVSHV